MLILKSTNYFCKLFRALHDIGASESPTCDYVLLLLMHQTDKPMLGRGVRRGGVDKRPSLLSANG